MLTSAPAARTRKAGALAGLGRGPAGGVRGRFYLRRKMGAGEALTEVEEAKFMTRKQRCLEGPEGGDVLGRGEGRSAAREAPCESRARSRRLPLLLVKHLPREGRRRRRPVAPKFTYHRCRRTDNSHPVWLQTPHDLGQTPGRPSQAPARHAAGAHTGAHSQQTQARGTPSKRDFFPEPVPVRRGGVRQPSHRVDHRRLVSLRPVNTERKDKNRQTRRRHFRARRSTSTDGSACPSTWPVFMTVIPSHSILGSVRSGSTETWLLRNPARPLLY